MYTKRKVRISEWKFFLTWDTLSIAVRGESQCTHADGHVARHVWIVTVLVTVTGFCGKSYLQFTTMEAKIQSSIKTMLINTHCNNPYPNTLSYSARVKFIHCYMMHDITVEYECVMILSLPGSHIPLLPRTNPVAQVQKPRWHIWCWPGQSTFASHVPVN